MKVLHLATYDNFGGAARAAYRLHLALRGADVDSRMLVRHKHTDDPYVQAFTGNSGFASRIDRTIRRAVINHSQRRSRAYSKTGLTDTRADLLRLAVPEMTEADVINIHRNEHFSDIPAVLASLPSSKPVVLTLHDMSPVTGGCDYPGKCEGFAKQCGCCPVLKSHRERDYSRKIFELRKVAYATRLPQKFALVANSRWTLENAKRSGLAAGTQLELIYYGLDQQIYQPSNRASARTALGIDAHELVVCFAAHNLSLEHKGGKELVQALAGLRLKDPIHLLTMGSGRVKAPPPFKHTHFGLIESELLQSLVYQAADVFVIPSLEEAFGQTALEAVACGTVVAGFAVGGIVDIVQNELNGHLVARGDSNALAEAITCLLKDEALRSRWRELCHAWVNARFSFERSATAYRALYERLLVAPPQSPCGNANGRARIGQAL